MVLQYNAIGNSKFQFLNCSNSLNIISFINVTEELKNRFSSKFKSG